MVSIKTKFLDKDVNTLSQIKNLNINNADSIKNSISAYSNLSMINNTIGWIVKDNKIFRTKDGFKSFNDITPYKDEIKTSVVTYFYDENTAWISLNSYTKGKKIIIYYTTDAGNKWEESYLPITQEWECEGNAHIYFVNNKNGFVLITSEPALGRMNKSSYNTIDGGKTWININ